MGWRDRNLPPRFEPVHGEGPTPCPVMLVGEGPGKEEDQSGRPFWGRTGQEVERYLTRAGLRWGFRSRDPQANGVYTTNITRVYPGEGKKAKVTQAEVDRWVGDLRREVAQVRPRRIITAGRWSTRFFVGDYNMEQVHGLLMPLRPELRGWAGLENVSAVLPCMHPAAGLHSADAQPTIAYDFAQIPLLMSGLKPSRVDEFPAPDYLELRDDERHSEATLKAYMRGREWAAEDTEGWEHDPWSVQFSCKPGTAIVLRPDKAQRLIKLYGQLLEDKDILVIMHNSMHDIAVRRAMGLRTRRFVDTMVLAYHLQVEPQGLKPLLFRHCGMRHKSYPDVVAEVEQQITFGYLAMLSGSLASAAPKPEPRVVMEAGRPKIYTPQPLIRWVKKMFADIDKHGLKRLSEEGEDDEGGDEDDDSEGDPKGDKPVDIRKRWMAVAKKAPELVQWVEARLGPMRHPTLSDVPPEVAVEYGATDADGTGRLYPKLLEKHGAMGLELVSAIDHGAIPMFERIQANGIPSRPNLFAKLEMTMEDRQARLSHELHKITGRFINPNSSAQVAQLAYGDLGIEITKRTKTRAPSTNKKALEAHRKTHRAIDIVGEWRECGKVKDSFAKPLKLLPSPVKATWRVTRVVSGRAAASNPPLMAIPVRTEIGQEVRRCFVAEEGEELWTWDLDQIEMRQMAHESQDPLLVSLFWDEFRDIHSETAALMFGLPMNLQAKTREERYWAVDSMKHRYPAKRVGFGVITGITGRGLLDQMRMAGLTDWTEEECDRIIGEWFKVYPGVAKYMRDCHAEARRNGYVKDMWSRMRYLPGVHSPIEQIRLEAQRQSHSHRISAGAQGILKRSMAYLWDEVLPGLWAEGYNVQPIAQIHDELLFKGPEGIWELVNPMMLNALTKVDLSPIKFTIPIKAKGARGKDWASLEK